MLEARTAPAMGTVAAQTFASRSPGAGPGRAAQEPPGAAHIRQQETPTLKQGGGLFICSEIQALWAM